MKCSVVFTYSTHVVKNQATLEMDFSALIADLRTIASRYNGKDTDRNVSTAMYCEMFRKVGIIFHSNEVGAPRLSLLLATIYCVLAKT